ncbi:MAG: hypothetical protein EAZ62_09625, partial [Sphingobacteriia bacterium]
MALVCLLLPTAVSAFQKSKSTVEVRIKPNTPGSRFGGKKAVVYQISVTNYLPTDQEGNLFYSIENLQGDEVLNGGLELRVNARKKLNSAFEIPLKDPGQYQLKIQVQLTNYQDYFNDKISYSGTPEKGRKPSGAVMGTALT